MNHTRKMEIFDKTVARMRELMETKGVEYSNDHDALANFKDPAHAEIGVDKYQAWAVLFNKHMSAIRSFMRKGEVMSDEPIEGRVDDALVYLVLFKCLLFDDRVPKS
jgi:hypothetical protein